MAVCRSCCPCCRHSCDRWFVWQANHVEGKLCSLGTPYSRRFMWQAIHVIVEDRLCGRRCMQLFFMLLAVIWKAIHVVEVPRGKQSMWQMVCVAWLTKWLETNSKLTVFLTVFSLQDGECFVVTLWPRKFSTCPLGSVRSLVTTWFYFVVFASFRRSQMHVKNTKLAALFIFRFLFCWTSQMRLVPKVCFNKNGSSY